MRKPTTGIKQFLIVFMIICLLAIPFIVFFINNKSTAIASTNDTELAYNKIKTYLFENTFKDLIDKNGGYTLSADVYAAIDDAFNDDIQNECECFLNFILQNSGKNISDIAKIDFEDFQNIILEIEIGAFKCDKMSRQLHFLHKFLEESTCYPSTDVLFKFIKDNINNQYSQDEEVNDYEIVLSESENSNYQTFLNNNNCCVNDKILCGSQCIDYLNDSKNCGSCGAKCDDGYYCANAECLKATSEAPYFPTSEGPYFPTSEGPYFPPTTTAAPYVPPYVPPTTTAAPYVPPMTTAAPYVPPMTTAAPF